MKKKIWLYIAIILVILAIGGKFTYDHVIGIVKDKAFQALIPELKKYSEAHPELMDQVDQAMKNAETDSENSSSISDSEQNNTQKTTVGDDKNSQLNDIPKVKSYSELEKYIDPADRNTASSIVFSIITADQIPRVIQLFSQNTSDSKKELKKLFGGLSAAQKNELLRIYNKYAYLLSD